MHAAAGTAHLVAQSDAEAVALARDVLAFLLTNNRAEAPRVAAEISSGSIADNVSDRDHKLDTIIPDTAAEAYDMHDVINTVVDEYTFFELAADAAENIITGFAYIEGRPVGIVANQPLALAGALDSAGSERLPASSAPAMPSIPRSSSSSIPLASSLLRKKRSPACCAALRSFPSLTQRQPWAS